MFEWIRRAFCSHRYDLADLTPRNSHGMVSCRCHKCGEVHTATYGLGLPGLFDRNTIDNWKATHGGKVPPTLWPEVQAARGVQTTGARDA